MRSAIGNSSRVLRVWKAIISDRAFRWNRITGRILEGKSENLLGRSGWLTTQTSRRSFTSEFVDLPLP